MRAPFFLAAILALACAGASAQAYRWVDRDGRVHYTQTPPPPEAKNVEKKKLGGGAAAEFPELPYATRMAMANFPVTLYTSAECGAACDQARSLLVKGAVPFREVGVAEPEQIENLKKISGKNQLPTLFVGSQMQIGYLNDAYNLLLDSAGYPASGPQLPLEALRKLDAPAKAAPAPQESAPAAR